MKLKDILEGDVVQFPGSKPEPEQEPETISNDEFFPKYWKQFKAMMDDLMRQRVVVNGKHGTFQQWYDNYLKIISQEERYQYVSGRLMGDIKAEMGKESKPHPGGSPEHLEYLRSMADNIHIHRKWEQVGQWKNKLDDYIEGLWDAEQPSPADNFSEFVSFGGKDQHSKQSSFASEKEVRVYSGLLTDLMNMDFYMDNDYSKKKRS